MKRGQVFVRAKDPEGKWGNADVLDLDETSWRAWILEIWLMKTDAVVSLKPEFVDGPELELIASTVA